VVLFTSTEWYRLMATGLGVVRRVVLLFFIGACGRRAQDHGQRSTGCVPGRCSSTVIFFLCGSFKAIARRCFLWLYCSRSSLVLMMATPEVNRSSSWIWEVQKILWVLLYFSGCTRSFVQVGGQLSLYLFRMYLYLYGPVYVLHLV